MLSSLQKENMMGVVYTEGDREGQMDGGREGERERVRGSKGRREREGERLHFSFHASRSWEPLLNG